MIILNVQTDKIEVALGGAVTANQLQCFTSWRDRTATSFIAGRTAINTNNTTDVDISGSPGASTQRIIDYISVFNPDTALANVTIKLDADGTEYILWKGDVATGGKVEFVEGVGFTYIPQSPQGYAINVQCITSSPADGATYYYGMKPIANNTTAGANKVYIRKAGILKIAEIYTYAGTAGTAEQVSMYIRKNNTTDYLIDSISSANNERVFSNAALSIPLAVGDYVEIKMVCPTWATNPLTFIMGGYIYIE